MSYGILLLRVVVGCTIAAHGAQKLFGWLGGPGPKGTAGFLGQLGFRSAPLLALLAGLAEASGALFALGLVTPLAALGMAVSMFVAIGTVHWPKGFWNTAGGYEYNLIVITVAAAVAMTGPGRFSLDRLIGWDDNLSGLWWGVAVLVLAALSAGIALTAFRGERGTHEAPA